MQPRRVDAHAKLTRTLAVVGVRADGYHLLESEMCLLDFSDELEITEGSPGLAIIDEIDWSGASAAHPALDVPTDASNLVNRALALAGVSASVRLKKRIPPGAGLGGGSADAAAVLRAFGVFDLKVAASLGADVPFCLRGGRARVGGIGDELVELEPISIDVVVVTPPFGVSTKAVYDAYDELGPPSGAYRNQLEPAALVVEPRLEVVRRAIEKAVGEQPTLAGSGSTYFLECAKNAGPALAERLRILLTSSLGPVLVRACTATEVLQS